MKTAVHQYEDKLLEFAYGELPAHEASAVDAHVRGCARCTQALGEIRSVRSAMAQLPTDPAPDAGLESLLAFAEVAAKRNAEAGKPVPFWKKYLTPLVLVATMVTVGVVATQANKEVDLSPAAAASDKTASEYSRRDEGKRAEAKKEAAPDPVAVAPMPAQAPAPEAAQNIVQNQKALDFKGNAQGGERDDEFSGLLGTKGKRGSIGGLDTSSRGGGGMPVTKSAPVEKKPMAKSIAEPKVMAEEKDSLAKAPPPPPGAGPSQDKNIAAGYGLSGGGRLSDYGNSGMGVRRQEAEGAVTPSTESVSPSPAPAATTAPLEAAKREAKADNAPVPQKKSMSVSGGSMGGASSAAAEDELADSLDRVAVDGDAKFAERQRAASASTSLENARTAANKGDRKGEVAYATEAINRGATGSARLEALTHLCNGYEALGQYAAADGWCDALLREFPNTSAAQNLAQRRGNTQQYRAAPTKASKSKAQPADAAQAQ